MYEEKELKEKAIFVTKKDHIFETEVFSLVKFRFGIDKGIYRHKQQVS